MSPTEDVRHFWLELWSRHDLDSLLERIDPEYVQQDHRALTDTGATREDWRQLMQSWWELVPDVRVVEFSPIATDGDHLVYGLRFAGHDSVSGGLVEIETFVVNEMRGGRFLRADLFNDADLAREHFDRACAARSTGSDQR